jgi:type II secretory pathway predicted ATPase ExeA/predicted outer membrane protein
MYLQHYGLDRAPFKITPDTSLFYKGSQRGAALEALKYAIVSGEGIIKVVGEVGSGKTMLCRMLELELPEHVEIGYIANPSLSPDNILHVIAFELKLNITNESSKLEVMQQLQNYLLKKHTQNKQIVIFVEEAQSMPIETLEEIRLLSNLETNENKLLQMVLFGQPELDEKLTSPGIRQLTERITHSFYLDPFAGKDIYEYLNYRMRLVGYKGPNIFSQKIANRIERKSSGLTRRINILADKALLAAYAEGDHSVNKKHINMAAIDSEFARVFNWRPLAGGVVATVVIGLAVWVGSLLPEAQKQLVYMDTKEIIVKAVRAENINQPAIESTSVRATQVNIEMHAQGFKTRQMQATDNWLNKAAAEDFTIQLVLLDAWAEKKVEDFIEMAGAKLDRDKIYIYQARIGGKQVYSILYNEYASRQQAEAQLRRLPKALTKNRPYLRTVKGIRADIRKSLELVNVH